MIEAIVGQPFDPPARVGPFRTGLATVGYQIVDEAGTVVIARTTTGVTEETAAPGFYDAAPTLATAGLYSIVWDPGDSSDITATEQIEVVGIDYSPTLEDVADFSPRTVVDGIQLDTFTADTKPTADQVSRLIGRATTRIEQRFGSSVPAALADDVKTVIALRAAMFIELRFFPEQVRADRSAYNDLKTLHDEAFTELLAAWRELGTDGLPDNEAGANQPALVAGVLTTPFRLPGSDFPYPGQWPDGDQPWWW